MVCLFLSAYYVKAEGEEAENEAKETPETSDFETRAKVDDGTTIMDETEDNGDNGGHDLNTVTKEVVMRISDMTNSNPNTVSVFSKQQKLRQPIQYKHHFHSRLFSGLRLSSGFWLPTCF